MTAPFRRPDIPPFRRNKRLVEAAHRARTLNDLCRLHEAVAVDGICGQLATALVDAEQRLLEAWDVR